MKVYNAVLHFSIFAFTFAFAWFVFIYYPKITSEFKSGHLPQAHLIPSVAAAKVTRFPVVMKGYTIENDNKSAVYNASIGFAHRITPRRKA